MRGDATTVPLPLPGVLRRAAAGAWHVPSGFVFLVRHPTLWPLAALPAGLALALLAAGAVAGVYLIPTVEASFAPRPGAWPEWVELPASLLLWTATIGAGAFLGLGLALLVGAPLLDWLSRRVETKARGGGVDSGGSFWAELWPAFRAGLYFVVAAPMVFALGLIPLIGPLLSVMLGARAVAMQMTDFALARHGASMRQRVAWHRRWLPESQGFGLAGMLGMLVPFANVLIAPALVTGATLLVLDLEEIEGRPEGASRPPDATSDPAPDPGPAAG
jgi:CysZ protein